MNDRMTIAEALAELARYGPAVWLGVLAAVATFAIEAVLCAKGILFSGGERKLERARKAGNVVLGALKTCRDRDREPEGKTANRLYTAVYAYTVDGVTREQNGLSSPARGRPAPSIFTASPPQSASFPSTTWGRTP